jgi:hypothetical protein
MFGGAKGADEPEGNESGNRADAGGGSTQICGVIGDLDIERPDEKEAESEKREQADVACCARRHEIETEIGILHAQSGWRGLVETGERIAREVFD